MRHPAPTPPTAPARRPWRCSRLPALALVAALALPVAAPAEPAAGQLEVVRDGEALTLRLSGPAGGFFGDPGAGDPDEVGAAAALLRDAGSLFRPSPAAGCRLERVELRGRELAAANESGVHDPGAQRAAFVQEGNGNDADDPVQSPEAEHAEADERSGLFAEYRYSCPRTGVLTEVAVQLFVSFPALDELQASVELDGQRHEQVLTATRPMLSLRPANE